MEKQQQYLNTVSYNNLGGLLVADKGSSVGVRKREVRVSEWQCYRSVTNRVPLGQSPYHQDRVYKEDAKSADWLTLHG